MDESRFSRIDRECPAFFVDAWEAANPEDRAEMIAFILGLPLDYPALALAGNDRRSELVASCKDAVRVIEHWPAPWRKMQGNQTYGAALIEDARGGHVVDCNSGGRTVEQSVDLAERILRAVNNHEALLAALRIARDSIEGLVPIEVLDAIAAAESPAPDG